ncbi:hypothetical protein CGMCC3_g15161 [Colletotrichum fructicola]|nr:uncharacterized protein CGMCC3_g15161 [Colletotrichum fructicola]KAE9568719.1 hypothetical protein CGMCC3_g15161 [Colletotrichum fructicola]
MGNVTTFGSISVVRQGCMITKQSTALFSRFLMVQQGGLLAVGASMVIWLGRWHAASIPRPGLIAIDVD